VSQDNGDGSELPLWYKEWVEQLFHEKGKRKQSQRLGAVLVGGREKRKEAAENRISQCRNKERGGRSCEEGGNLTMRRWGAGGGLHVLGKGKTGSGRVGT